MTAFLKIDRCRECTRELPWEWVPPVTLGTKPLAGTGVWRSTLVNDLCPACAAAAANTYARLRRAHARREQFIRLVGGIKPYRVFTFERYRITPANRAAFAQAKAFDASKLNLYLWGPCGVGKTHLAVAILRQSFTRGASGAMTTPFQLVRRLRMKAPDDEQRTIDELVNAKVLVIDDLGAGAESVYARQALQEILDRRDCGDRGGLVVTSPFSPTVLGRRMGDGAVASRLAGMCRVVEVAGDDFRRFGPEKHEVGQIP